MTQSFFIGARLPGWNEMLELRARSPHAYAKTKKKWGGVVAMFARTSKLKGVKGPVKMHFHFFEPNARRDPDNMLSAAKMGLDALQEIGVLPGDSQMWIRGLSFSWEVSEGPHGIKVTMEDA